MLKRWKHTWKTLSREAGKHLTGIVDEQIQSGLGLQEVLSEGVNWLQVRKIHPHEDDLLVPRFLRIRWTRRYKSESWSQVSGCESWSQVFIFTWTISCTAASVLCWSLQARMTLAPLLARPMAVSLPMPVLAPTDGRTLMDLWRRNPEALHPEDCGLTGDNGSLPVKQRITFTPGQPENSPAENKVKHHQDNPKYQHHNHPDGTKEKLLKRKRPEQLLSWVLTDD